MSRIGIIAEKPSQARNFSRALFGTESKSEGTLNGDLVRVVALRGHLFELVKPDEMYEGAGKLAKWGLDTLPWDETSFSWAFEPRDGVSDVISHAKGKLSGMDEIVIATDDDPGTHEGSGLACELLLHEDISAARLSRMYFVDESEREVRKAFEDRKAIPSDLETWSEWRVAFFRNRWDYLMGLQSTRAATKLGDGEHVVRSGRLKSAMVVICAEQIARVKAYKKVPFYDNRFRDENGVTYADPDEPRYASKGDVPARYHASDVVVDSKTMKRTAPPRLMDLAAISAALAPKGISAKQVLDTYQVGYERYQWLSYPRTEDKTVTPEQFDDLLANADEIARVVGVDPATLTHRQPRPCHVKPKGAHGANRPGPKVPASLEECEKMGAGGALIYELVARSALAMLAEDYEYEQQVGHVSDYPTFVGKANVPRRDGWHAVLGRDNVDKDEDESARGLGTHAEPFVHEGFPPKPQRPTMKWLMRQLEKRSVGTGATRTSTYSEVTSGSEKSRLLNDRKGAISMAAAGDVAATLLPGTHIGSLDLTESVFDQMRGIEEGKLDPEACLHEVASLVAEDISTMRKNAQAAGLGKAGDATEYAEGTFQGKSIRFKRVWCAHRFTDDEVAGLLAGDKIRLTDCVSPKTGNAFACEGHLEEGTCKGRTYFGFKSDGFVDSPSCGPRTLPATWCGHKFTKREAEALRAGKAVRVKGLKSKRTGKTFDATVSWSPKGGFDLTFD